MQYTISLIKDRSSHTNAGAIKKVHSTLVTDFKRDGVNFFGAFTPLFGLASNELYLVTSAEKTHDLNSLAEQNSLEVLETNQMVPTVRPTDHATRTQPGIYVFRWFSIYTKDIAEIARLSNEAWQTFEGGFDTEVQGLFRDANPGNDQGKMLLITWYRDLSVWEASRFPAPEARENFLRRANLTIEARPIATRLAAAP